MRKIAVLTIVSILAALLASCTGAEDGNGNGDTTPPVISDVSASDITETGAVITWTTDEPCSYSVDYGLTSEYGATASSILSELVTNPSINLSGLSADTIYHYRVKSEDASGNEAISGDYVFTTPTPTVVRLVSQTALGNNQVSYHASVDDEGVVPKEAEIRATHNDSANGAVVFVTGGWGKGWYGDGSNTRAQIVEAIRDDGYETYEIAWLGEQGWATGSYGQGLKKATSAFSEVVRWIATDLAVNPEVIGITGTSAGSELISYGLAIHGLEEVFDIVVLTAGPVSSDTLSACCMYPNPTGGRVLDYIMGWLDDGDYCQTGNCTDLVIQALLAESIVTPLPVPGEVRDYYYPDTRVVFIEGEDDAVAVNLGVIFYDAITSDKSWVVLPGVGHGVPGDVNGAAAIQDMLLDGLAAHT
jgi:hypothetical protein